MADTPLRRERDTPGARRWSAGRNTRSDRDREASRSARDSRWSPRFSGGFWL